MKKFKVFVARGETYGLAGGIIGYFSNEQDAIKAAEGRSYFGDGGDGLVEEQDIAVYDSYEEFAGEEKLSSAEYKEYLRLKEKFDGTASLDKPNNLG